MIPCIGDYYMAADGGDYGCIVVGVLPEVEDAIIMPSNKNGSIIYSNNDGFQEPIRIDYYKLSYRYIKIGNRDLSEKR